MLQQLRPALVSVLAFTVIMGGIFPAIVWGIGQAAFNKQANGSLIREGDKIVGSELIGQSFTKPEYFHPRPSAAGSGYGADTSSGTNLGPTSDKLLNGIPDNPATKDTDESYSGVKQLAEAYRIENRLAANAPVPADAVTRSASGLDPHISPENATLQIARVAKARGKSENEIKALVTRYTEGRDLGVLGEPRVNVLMLNRALDGK